MDFIVIAIIVLILALAITYIVRQKKKGVQCIGCPMSGKCSGHCKSEEEMPEFIDIKNHSYSVKK
ncbi:MAG: FeoB-associated Cys-rich membrane protein [Clostridia bacterium]